MLTDAELTSMRSTSTSALPDLCAITRAGQRGALNTVTGAYPAGPRAPIYSGPCRVRPVDGQETDAAVGDVHETLGRYVVTIPHDADTVQVDDRLEVTASADTELVGRRLRVLHIGLSSFQLDRRLIVQDREQP